MMFNAWGGQWLERKSKVVATGPVLAYLIVVLLGWVNFTLWVQVRDCWDMTFCLLIHYPRLLLTVPSFAVGEFLAVSPDYLFSILVPLSFVMTAYYMMLVVARRENQPNRYLHFALFYVALMAMSLFMNGRGVFALAGSALLLDILTGDLLIKTRRAYHGFLAKQCIGFWMVCVSSGTYITSFVFFFTAFAYFLFRGKVYFTRLQSLMALVIFCIFSVLLWGYLMKNIAFFGGGPESVIKMLQHGLGHVLQEINIYWLAFSFVAAGSLFVFLWKWLSREVLLTYVIVVVLFLGLFGYLVLIVGVPAFFVLFFIVVHRLRSYQWRL